jgi:hypothetical protein
MERGNSAWQGLKQVKVEMYCEHMTLAPGKLV